MKNQTTFPHPHVQQFQHHQVSPKIRQKQYMTDFRFFADTNDDMEADGVSHISHLNTL